jgi:hypothetical protein
MRIQRALLSVVLMGFLAGCTAPPEPDPTTEPSGTPTPEVEVAPVGEAAIPLGCSDILAVEDVAHLGADVDEQLSLAIHENRIKVDMSVAELQLGTLRCIWAARYGSTDFHAVIDLRVAPTTATELVPAEEESYAGVPVAVDGDPATLLACGESFQADESPALYNGCDVTQLRAGYRIDFETSGLKAAAGRDPSVALELLSRIDTAIDAAGPARLVEPVDATTDPAALCRAPEIAPLLEHVGATGDPSIEPSGMFPSVTTCTWTGLDEYGNPLGPWVEVLPGGAWAIPRLGSGVSSIFMPTHASADGSFVIGVGDGVSAWRAIGDDLVHFISNDFDAATGWDAFLESTW